MIATFRRYDEALIAAAVSEDPQIKRNWQETANRILEALLDETVEIEAAESKPAAWAEKNPWDHKAKDKMKKRRRPEF